MIVKKDIYLRSVTQLICSLLLNYYITDFDICFLPFTFEKLPLTEMQLTKKRRFCIIEM